MRWEESGDDDIDGYDCADVSAAWPHTSINILTAPMSARKIFDAGFALIIASSRAKALGLNSFF